MAKTTSKQAKRKPTRRSPERRGNKGSRRAKDQGSRRPTVSASDLRDATFNLGGAADEVRIYGDYSGRGMYGETCAAIVAPDESMIAQILVELARLDAASEIAVLLARQQRLDSMGRGVVAYYPGVDLDGEGDEERE